MTEVLAKPAPVFEALPATTETCDGHADGAVKAVVRMTTAGGGTVMLCGNCARKAGYEHVKGSG